MFNFAHINRKSIYNQIYLWNKVVCFILSCWDLPNHGASCHALGIFKKLSMNGVHQLGLRLFGSMVRKLLLLNHFFNGIWVHSWCCWKSLDKSNLIKFISQFHSQGVEDINFLSGFCFGNSNKLSKLGLEGKISWALNVFTFGPTTHATLVIIN